MPVYVVVSAVVYEGFTSAEDACKWAEKSLNGHKWRVVDERPTFQFIQVEEKKEP
jgi:hypothetical protein